MDRQLAGRLLGAGVALGLTAQAMLFDVAPGINVFCLLAGILLVAGGLVGVRRFDRADWWLPPAALVLAAFIFIRSDGGLLSFDLAASVGLTIASLSFSSRRSTR
jgi:hypothetical protein